MESSMARRARMQRAQDHATKPLHKDNGFNPDKAPPGYKLVRQYGKSIADQIAEAKTAGDVMATLMRALKGTEASKKTKRKWREIGEARLGELRAAEIMKPADMRAKKLANFRDTRGLTAGTRGRIL